MSNKVSRPYTINYLTAALFAAQLNKSVLVGDMKRNIKRRPFGKQNMKLILRVLWRLRLLSLFLFAQVNYGLQTAGGITHHLEILTYPVTSDKIEHLIKSLPASAPVSNLEIAAFRSYLLFSQILKQYSVACLETSECVGYIRILNNASNASAPKKSLCGA
ncbi:hypothetical protein K469DRAFT_699811 [Zopfia rhizophila CBS 207.26]|uniref:Uncharacterized protein n=1 Tax=Zopfia rhizophila CBS 207.26 TaxID=1314779 RepID=A0A6A6EHW5_9PEZI|nr:hypothetical protein K469DRAFT_699811 [Zopfia rhizophila CBS 207.26]